jgi:hypothetical protein
VNTDIKALSIIQEFSSKLKKRREIKKPPTIREVKTESKAESRNQPQSNQEELESKIRNEFRIELIKEVGNEMGNEANAAPRDQVQTRYARDELESKIRNELKIEVRNEITNEMIKNGARIKTKKEASKELTKESATKLDQTSVDWKIPKLKIDDKLIALKRIQEAMLNKYPEEINSDQEKTKQGAKFAYERLNELVNGSEENKAKKSSEKSEVINNNKFKAKTGEELEHLAKSLQIKLSNSVDEK